ncbi:PilX N-terminal domain-containing pilus assembly protein [Planctomycetota bacterium]
MQILNRKTGGIVLVVVLGVLALLSVLAITFVSMTRLERSISRNYVDRTRAVMVAESGIEYAIKRIANFRGGVILPEEMAAMQYQDGDYAILLESADRPSFQIPGKPYSGIVSSTHAADSERFKLKVTDLSSRINLNDSNEELNLPEPPYDTGRIPFGTRRLSLMISYLCELLFAESMGAGIGDAVASRIETAKIAKGCFTSMAEIKTILFEEVGFGQAEWLQFQQYFTIHGWQDNKVLRPTFKVDISVPGDADPATLYDDGGADLYMYRDMQTRFFTLDTRSPININTASIEIIQTLFANVAGWYLLEGPAENLSNGHYGSWKIVRYVGNLYDPDADGIQYNPFEYYYRDENSWDHSGRPLGKRNTFGKITRTLGLEDPAAPGYDPNRLPAIAGMIWNRIHDSLDINGDGDYIDPMESDHPKPFATWDEFSLFIKTVFAPGADGYSLLLPDDAALGIDPALDEAEKLWWRDYYFEIYSDQYLANFNPNSQLNDYNPNLSTYRHIDKSQLTLHTTEICFEPTGIFEISSFGEVFDTAGVQLAATKIRTQVQVFEYFRVTTQADFMAGYQVEDDLADYISLSTSMTTALAADSNPGYSLQSYPEPVTEENYFAESVFDGQLKLATWQAELNEYGVEVSAEVPPELNLPGQPFDPRPILRASFTRDLKPDVFGLNPYTDFDVDHCGSYFYRERNPELKWDHLFNQPANAPLTHSFDPEYPVAGSLFPDGVLSDATRTVGIAGGNFGKADGHIGALHFWVKPNFDAANSTRVRKLLCMFKQGNRNNMGHVQAVLYYFSNNDTNIEDNFAFYGYFSTWAPTRFLVAGWGLSCNNVVGMFSTTVNHQFPGHSEAQHGIYPEYNFESHQWNHIGLSWNMLGIEGALESGWFLGMAINGEDVNSTRWGTQGFNPDSLWSIWEDPRDPWEPNIFRFGESVLGHRKYPIIYSPGGMRPAKLDGTQNYIADCTFDEVIGYLDFVPAEDMLAFWDWGRYYGENDATYTSPPIDLHRQLKLDRREVIRPRSVTWTVYWPKYNRDGDEIADNILPPNIDGDLLDTDDPYDPVPDDPMADKWGEPRDPISIDIGLDDGSYTEWQYNNDPLQMPTYAGGSKLDAMSESSGSFVITSNLRFRYQVRFNLEPGQTLYDTPVFDDISFTFHIKPKILRWQVVN